MFIGLGCNFLDRSDNAYPEHPLPTSCWGCTDRNFIYFYYYNFETKNCYFSWQSCFAVNEGTFDVSSFRSNSANEHLIHKFFGLGHTSSNACTSSKQGFMGEKQDYFCFQKPRKPHLDSCTCKSVKLCSAAGPIKRQKDDPSKVTSGINNEV